MNAHLLTQEKLNRRWFRPVVGFVVERLVLGSLAALIVYAGYRMFLL